MIKTNSQIIIESLYELSNCDTHMEFARKLHISDSTLSRLFHGNSCMNIDILSYFCKATGCNVEFTAHGGLEIKEETKAKAREHTDTNTRS